ncbi:MAG: heme o synthase [Acidobacteriota bacterium]|nr:heme o synthase [Acidobacteriota bacterium]MDH3525648.1 heme o synthase [Acidobacteriota bacterium]
MRRPSPPSGGPLADWMELTKPRITLMVLLTAGIGILLAAPARPDLELVASALLGTWLVAAGSSALNHALEHELDALMVRTAGRPVASGRMAARAAIAFGLLLGCGGLLLLAWRVNWTTAILGLVAFLGYVVVYTPLKVRSSLATIVGAVPGAIPPMMGWTAVTGELQAGAWVLFGILFLWQLPHFLAIAWMCREDYARAGFPMLPVVQPNGHSTARQMVLYSAALIPVSLGPVVLGLAGQGYLAGALVLGLGYTALGVAFARTRSDLAARRVLLASVLYLPAVLGVLAVDRIV